MQNPMVMIAFPVFSRKYPFWANLVKKINIVSLIWNLVPRLIRICKIQWLCSLFFVFDWKYPFLINLVLKIKIISLNWKLAPIFIRTCRTQWWCSVFLFYTRNTLSGKFGPKSQNCQFKLKFGTYNRSQNIWAKV